MSKLQELIKKLCPDGVEFRKLGEVCELSRGKVYSKTYINNNIGNYPVYSSQTANNGELGKISSYDYDGEYLTWTTDGAYAGTIFHRQGRFSITNVCGLITIKSNKLLVRFLYYWLSIKAKEYVYQGMGNPKLMTNQMEIIEIPLPPLEVQKEIVRILDAFTAHTAELQAELQARKEQYEYYRNKLLTFDENDERVKWMMLGKVCNMKRGKRLTTKDLSPEGEYPVYHGGIEAIGKYTAYNREGNSVMIINVGASAGTIGFCNTKFWSSDGCFCFEHNSVINQKYLYFVLQTLEPILKSKVRKAGIPTLDNKVVERLIIPILPIPEQERIVSILDKFESLVNDLSEGLPAEIAAVQEQYEYYRNKLLTFRRMEKL